ncbi:MAG: helix-turn-helix domain-containing protein [Bacteroidota bacterium]
MEAPSFDHWTSLFLVVAIQGIFLGVSWWVVPRGDRSSNRLLGTVMLLVSMMLLDFVAYWTRYIYTYHYLMAWYHLAVPLMGPLLWGYSRRMLGQAAAFRWKDAWHLLPFVALAAYWIPLIVQPGPTKQQWFVEWETSIYHYEHGWAMWGNWLQVIQALAYAGALLWLAFRQSMPEEMDPASFARVQGWIKTLACLFAAFAVAFFSYYAMVALDGYYMPYDYAISFSMSILIFTIGYLGFRQPQLLHPAEQKRQRHKYQKSSLPDSVAATYAEQLKQLMQAEQLFLRPDLNAQDLAKALGISVHQLSQVLNQQLEQRFSDFVNGYRVAQAEHLLATPAYASTPLVQIGYEVGFNSKNAFGLAFKKLRGKTPSEARAELQVG